MTTEPAILQRVRADGHRVFTGPWNVNLIGVRSANRDQAGDLFDDWLHCVFQTDAGNWIDLCFQATTDPGRRWLEKKGGHGRGAAIMAPGQYRGLWALGLHRRRVPALVQVGRCRYYRDKDRDTILDMDPATIEDRIVGLNCHPAGPDSKRIGLWSAGCQVVANQDEFDTLLSICRRSSQYYGPRFTYTLIEAPL